MCFSVGLLTPFLHAKLICPCMPKSAMSKKLQKNAQGKSTRKERECVGPYLLTHLVQGNLGRRMPVQPHQPMGHQHLCSHWMHGQQQIPHCNAQAEIQRLTGKVEQCRCI